MFWMLAEGLQIYSSIVKVFGGERKLKFFYFLGWGKVSSTLNKYTCQWGGSGVAEWFWVLDLNRLVPFERILIGVLHQA